MYIFIIIFVSCSLSCMIPYPVFNSSNILSVSEQQYVNDVYENEIMENNKSENIVVKNLDWFEVVNNFFEKYKKTRVIDVQTKKQYYVMRTGGYNHADVETIDITNTNIFKSLYGEWSWLRRPVWVEINGVFVAGSINGMPHGYSTISGNNEGGHTCIHFLNSKTHGTKRVDEAHQDAIQTAYNRAKELTDFLLKINKY